MSAPALTELRLLMRKKFPQAHAVRFEEEPVETPRLLFSDPATFPAGEISEIIPSGPEPILGLFLAELLGEPENTAAIPDFALIDGDTFDPASYPRNAASRLLWVRCRQLIDLMKAADLLIRDGNIPFVLLDLCHFPAREIRALPASHWWRLKQIAGQHANRVLVLPPFPTVPCAAMRLALSADLTLADFERPRAELLPEIRIDPQRLRRAT